MLRAFPTPPPYGLRAVPAFPLPALAALAGRSSLGGARETVLACLLAARLALALLPPEPLSDASRRARAQGTLEWLAATAVPPAVRDAASAVAEASTRAPDAAPPALAAALRALAPAAAAALDDPAMAELTALADALAATGPTP